MFEKSQNWVETEPSSQSPFQKENFVTVVESEAKADIEVLCS